MAWTKQDYIEQAFDELGLSAYFSDLDSDQMQKALIKLDSMLATWNADGIRIGYPLPSSPGGSLLTTETGVPDAANEAIYLNLAIRLAPAYGKTVQAETKLSAARAYNALINRFLEIIEFQMPQDLPSGAGNRRADQYNKFVIPPSDPLLVGPDGKLEF